MSKSGWIQSSIDPLQSWAAKGRCGFYSQRPLTYLSNKLRIATDATENCSMTSRLAILCVAVAALSSCGGGGGGSKPRPTPTPPSEQAVTQWQIGPVIDGKNFSTGMPLHPTARADGWSIDFGPGQSPHYVTKASGSLAGKTAIMVRFRTEGAPIVGEKCGANGTLTLYFEDSSNDWHGDYGRWWATLQSVALDHEGSFEIVAPLDGGWSSVFGGKDPATFAKAKGAARRVGFTLGNCEGYGHGVTSTGQARIVVTHFGVE